MSDGFKGKGTCLCGSVSIMVAAENKSVGACHCNMCRKWGGGPYMEIDCGSNVSFEGKENISVFASSDWAERGFCKNCGTHLFYRVPCAHKTVIAIHMIRRDINDALGSRVIPFFIERGVGYEVKLYNPKWIMISGLLIFLIFIISELFLHNNVRYLQINEIFLQFIF